MSSLENISSEAIQCLAFADSYTKKSEPCMFPTLWVGTSLGSVLTIMINLPPPGETRITQPVVVSPCGSLSPSLRFNSEWESTELMTQTVEVTPTLRLSEENLPWLCHTNPARERGGSACLCTIFRLKGSILTMSFLDCNGALIPYSFETWRDENKDREKIMFAGCAETPTKSSSNNRMSPTLSSGSGSQDQFGDRQFVVFTSEKQSRVVALPSHNCVYRQQLADVDFVVKAEIISLKDSVCLVCYSSNGHITAYSLPSLRPLIDYDFLPLTDQSFQTTKQGIVDPMLSIWGQQMFVNEDTDHNRTHLNLPAHLTINITSITHLNLPAHLNINITSITHLNLSAHLNINITSITHLNLPVYNTPQLACTPQHQYHLYNTPQLARTPQHQYHLYNTSQLSRTPQQQYHLYNTPQLAHTLQHQYHLYNTPQLSRTPQHQHNLYNTPYN
uniref:Uncharacterized protein n=1 Tax=Timema monikensis TaxID=170555 RepID=A0A7R9E4M5_9NEOP|nr:unnamed protein product [Timema monikensis]